MALLARQFHPWVWECGGTAASASSFSLSTLLSLSHRLSNALRWSGALVAVCVLANRRIFNGGHERRRVRSDARIKEYSWSGGHGQRGPVNDLFASATHKIICSQVKEKVEMSSLFVHEEDERVPLTSCVVYPGPSLEQAYFLNLHMDNRKIFRVSNDEEGVTALMS
ncbi:uncharacterized protein LOC142775319 [Rhipicephalus microplus]|uniref:uncharacterized protein LOC142775319 n=1 Tax=Rhipicephalus microplus TaxID=6941 RepID=UPI003F6C0F8E